MKKHHESDSNNLSLRFQTEERDDTKEIVRQNVAENSKNADASFNTSTVSSPKSLLTNNSVSVAESDEPNGPAFNQPTIERTGPMHMKEQHDDPIGLVGRDHHLDIKGNSSNSEANFDTPAGSLTKSCLTENTENLSESYHPRNLASSPHSIERANPVQVKDGQHD